MIMEKKATKKWTVGDGCILLLVLFGIAASLVSPGVTQAFEEKKLGDLVDRLYTTRTQILLYKAHHNGLLPGQQFRGDSVTADEFATALQQQRPDGSGCYLSVILENPYMTDPARRNTVICVNDVNAIPAGTEQTAWWFNAATGDFFACDSEFHTKY